MSDFELLEQLVALAAKVPVVCDPTTGKCHVTLVEPQDPSSKVTVYGLPADAVVIKADLLDLRTVFIGSKGENKRADYIIIAEAGAKKRILYIEMKKSKDLEWSIIAQLRGAACFMTFCKEIAKEFWQERNFLSGFEPRFVSIGKTGSINKQKTRVDRKSPCNNTPEALMKIAWPHRCEFHHLVGR